jgi:hypothetical protein
MRREDVKEEEEQVKKIIAEGGIAVYGLDWYATPFEPCDSACLALREPETLNEALRALEHYKHHSYLSGCAHGR